MQIDVILGLQWGDEGKGKIVDYLAPGYDLIARFQGGPNAGHTLRFDGKKFVLHTVPSGIFREKSLNLIGNGVVIDPIALSKELSQLSAVHVPFQERLLVARKAHLILPTHRYLDMLSENAKGAGKIGSTLRGIGPAYMDKTGRNGLRIGDIESPDFQDRYAALKAKHLSLAGMYPPVDFDLEKEEASWFAAIDHLRVLPFVDGEYFINRTLAQGKRILDEGAQGSMLDIDFGTYPFVTSSNTITAGVCTGLGVSPDKIGEVIGITKAYCTRVGSGPFPTELMDETGEKLRKEGNEFGATTGRPRRCGWIDLPQLRYAAMVNGVTQIAVTKLDVLNSFAEIHSATAYQIGDNVSGDIPYDLCAAEIEPIWETHPGWKMDLTGIDEYHQLPLQAKSYIQFIEHSLEIPVSMISTGPERDQLIIRPTDY